MPQPKLEIQIFQPKATILPPHYYLIYYLSLFLQRFNNNCTKNRMKLVISKRVRIKLKITFVSTFGERMDYRVASKSSSLTLNLFSVRRIIYSIKLAKSFDSHH